LRFTNLSPTVQSLSLGHYVHHLSYDGSFLFLPPEKRFRPYVKAGVGAALFYISGHSKEEARALVGLVPDFVVLFRRLLSDRRVSRRRKVVLAALIPYLAMPFDLVPDFIPVAGYLDDAVIVAFVLRHVLRGSGPELIEEHWPGPPTSLALVLRLAGYKRTKTPTPEPPPA
jgi:uncharacterized membrane protein YkvA (DUF1232 family)